MEPAVVVGGFGGEEVGDFGVRQDQELFFALYVRLESHLLCGISVGGVKE